MDPVERMIGRLDEFKYTTMKRLDRIETKVDRLNEFKWRVAGGAALLSIVLTFVAQYVFK